MLSFFLVISPNFRHVCMGVWMRVLYIYVTFGGACFYIILCFVFKKFFYTKIAYRHCMKLPPAKDRGKEVEERTKLLLGRL